MALYCVEKRLKPDQLKPKKLTVAKILNQLKKVDQRWRVLTKKAANPRRLKGLKALNQHIRVYEKKTEEIERMMPEMANRQTAFNEDDLNLEDSDDEKSALAASHSGSEEEKNKDKESTKTTVIETGSNSPGKVENGKGTPTFRILAKRTQRPAEEDISEQHWLSEFYEALLDVEHGRADMEVREKKLESLLEGRAVGLRKRTRYVPYVLRSEETQDKD